MAWTKLLIGSALAVAAVAQAQESEIAWQNDYDATLGLAKEEGKPVLIDFYADWCGPCKMMDAQTFTDPRVIRAVKDFVPVKVDVDRNENVAYAYRIQSIPRTVVLNIYGEVVGDRIGFLDADDYLAFLEQVQEFTHTRFDGQRVDVPVSRAATVAISDDTEDTVLIELLGDPDPAVRKRAEEELLSRDRGNVERILARAAAHEYLGVRLAAYEILDRISGADEPNFDPWDPAGGGGHQEE